MTALWILLGNAAILVILLRIPAVCTILSEDDLEIKASWLFLRYQILPAKEP